MRNCVIKFNLGPKNRETRTLRKPIFIGGFKFADDNPEVKRDLEIAWLPDPKAITTQLGELKPQQFGKTYYENDMISKKSPVRIAFSDIDYEQMSWVLVTADVKAKTKLSASLQLGLDPRQRPKLAKPELLDDALNWLNQNAVQAKRQSDQIKGISIDALRKQTNNQSLTFPQKQKMEANFKQRSDIAQEQTKKFDEQRKNSIDKFYGKVIPITISYKLGNQQITLATTKPEK